MCASKYIFVKCQSCAMKYLKRKDSLKGWAGNCFPCGNIVTANLPHVKELTRVRNGGSKSNFWRGGVSTQNE